MIRVTVLYPNREGIRFDSAYYLEKHMPMVKQKLGAACKRVAVEQGLGGAEPGSKPPNVAICQLDFESVDAFQSAFAPHAGEILGDIPNYTSVQPIIQVSEVKM
jgi:uncharacterized protein (TIGR02118 family)